MDLIKGGDETEYRDTMGDFVDWCSNNLHLNASKTKEMVVDFGKNRPKPVPVSIRGTEVDLVSSLRYLGVLLDNKID